MQYCILTGPDYRPMIQIYAVTKSGTFYHVPSTKGYYEAYRTVEAAQADAAALGLEIACIASDLWAALAALHI